MAFGGFLAISDRRYRLVSKKREEEELAQAGEGVQGATAHKVATSEK
jgi:hypothetical protein